MARGNLILGQGAGKLGDVVLYRNAGQQQARAYVSNPKNPKSYKQALQRAKFASVALAYQYFKKIVDRSTRYRDGRTAYNDFLKNNISAAPYASKSERQEWAGLYTLPAQWVAAFGALARPACWTPTFSAGSAGTPSTVTFCTTYQLLNQILSYALSVGWIPAVAQDGASFEITKEQLAEAMAGAPNCHVVIATSNSAKVGAYNTAVGANGVRVLELTADVLTTLTATLDISYTDGIGWEAIIDEGITIGGAGGSLVIADGSSATENVAKDVHLNLAQGVPVGYLFSSWIGNNSGSSVQVSNIIFEIGGTDLNTTATTRRDETEAETAAAIASWQTEEAAGSDSNIY